jgi:dsRNA-specific ribonuclease
MQPQTTSISQLKEWADKQRCAQPTYACTAPAGASNWHCRGVLLVPQHPGAAACNTLTADGAGRSKQEAKNAAAASLLMQLEQQGLLHARTAAAPAAPAGPAGASSSTQQQAGSNNISCINQLSEFLITYGKGMYQVSYSDAARVPGTPDHRPQWTVQVQLLQLNSNSSSSSSSTPQLTAAGSGPNRSGAKHAAAAALLLSEDFTSLFAGNPAAASALATATAAARSTAVEVPQAHGAVAVARASPIPPAEAAAAAAAAAAGPAAAPAPLLPANYKNRLQELMQKAASKRLLGWDGWQLPTYR